MLKAAYSAPDMLDELRGADEFFKPFFDGWTDAMMRYHGPGYREDEHSEQDGGTYDPENFSLEWVSLIASQCVFGNPRVRIRTNRRGEAAELAKAHQFALNRLVRASKIRNLNKKLVVDYGFRWFVTVTLPAWEMGFSEREDPKGWPSVKRISPRRFGWDPVAQEWEDKRYAYHKTISDKDDLEDRARQFPDEGWNLDRIEGLTEDAGLDDMRSKPVKDYTPIRGEIVLYHVWVPEYFPTNEDMKFHGAEKWEDPNRHGAWLTLGWGQDADGDDAADWVRRPYPYIGHRSGPYTMAGTYVIPDEVGPLAVIASVKAQTDERNDHARVLSKAMAVHKKGILVDGTDPDWEDKIREFEDHWVVALEGLDEISKKVVEIEIGGATELHIVHNEILKARVERATGISEAMQGKPRPGVTATAEMRAEEHRSIRVGFQIMEFREGVKDYLEKLSWYLVHEQVDVELGPEANGQFFDPETGEALEQVVYHGGLVEGEEELGDEFWDALGFEIEPYSMTRTSEGLQQKRVLDLAQLVGYLAPMMVQLPFVEWDKLLEQIGDAMNMPTLGDMFDMDELAEFRNLVLGIQLEQGKNDNGTGGQSRIPRDIMSGLQAGGGGSAGGNGSFGSMDSPLGKMLGSLSGAEAGADVG